MGSSAYLRPILSRINQQDSLDHADGLCELQSTCPELGDEKTFLQVREEMATI